MQRELGRRATDERARQCQAVAAAEDLQALVRAELFENSMRSARW